MWTYLKFTQADFEADIVPAHGIELPPSGTVYQAFDAFRWSHVIGYGKGCILTPNVDDDCEIIAFAPINETEEPDQERLKEAYPFGPCYKPPFDLPILLRNNFFARY